MKNTKRRTEILIETREITIIRTNAERLTAFCESCREDVPAFAPEQIAAFFQISGNDVCRRLEEKTLHLIASERAFTLVCGNSLRSEKTEIEFPMQ